MRNGWRGGICRCCRYDQECIACGWVRTENTGDRDLRHLCPLQGRLRPLTASIVVVLTDHADHQREPAGPNVSGEYQLVVSAPVMAVAALLVGERVTHMPLKLAFGALAYQTIWVCERDVRYPVRADCPILGQSALGVHFSHAAVRGCSRPPAARRSINARVCGSRGACCGGMLLINRSSEMGSLR